MLEVEVWCLRFFKVESRLIIKILKVEVPLHTAMLYKV
jgi:hypothetical protein